MQVAARAEGLSVDDYLAAERASDIKHEYVGGALYAMAGGTKEHNQIAGNIYALIRSGLRGGPCRVFIADLKVRLRVAGEDIFYYPDVMVGCDARDTDRDFLRFPKVIVEVLSSTTERLDRREKWWSYQTIETLEEYVLVAQDRVEVTLFRRANHWQAEVSAKLTDTIDLKSLPLVLPIAAVYDGVLVG